MRTKFVCMPFPCSSHNSGPCRMHWVWVAVWQWGLHRSQSQVWQEVWLQRRNRWVWLWWVSSFWILSYLFVLLAVFCLESCLHLPFAFVWFIAEIFLSLFVPLMCSIFTICICITFYTLVRFRVFFFEFSSGNNTNTLDSRRESH